RGFYLGGRIDTFRESFRFFIETSTTVIQLTNGRKMNTIEQIIELKKELGNRVIIPAHHY
nr:hypothetical protein [Candidatus Cloacimonadota bacterium]